MLAFCPPEFGLEDWLGSELSNPPELILEYSLYG